MLKLTGRDDIDRAQLSLDIALNHLNWATSPRMIDAAVFEVSAAEFRLRAALDRAKGKSWFSASATKRPSLFCPNTLVKHDNGGNLSRLSHVE